jgi:uncharacterized protein (TIGR03067 family)
LLLLLSRESLSISVSSSLLASAVAAAQLGKAGAAVTAGAVSVRAWEWAAAALKSGPVWRPGTAATVGLAAATVLLVALCAWQLSPAWAGFRGGRTSYRCAGGAALQHDRELVQGTWVLAAQERNGRRDAPDSIKGCKVVIELDEATFFTRDRRENWRFGVDTKADRHWIDLVQGGLVRQGIYKLQDETLTLCLALPGEKRPADFSTASETRCTLHTYRRETGGVSGNGPTPP